MSTGHTDETVLAETFYRHFYHSLGPYLDQVGIPAAVLTDPSLSINLWQFVKVLEVAARGRGEDDLGLRLGVQINQEDVGVLGHALTSAATVEQLLLTTERNVAVYAMGVDIALVRGEKYSSLRYQLTDSAINERRQDSEFSISLLHTLIKRSAGSTWRLHEVHFEHAKPVDASPHQHTFRAPVKFNKPCNALVFETRLLRTPLATADPRLFSVLQKYLEQAMAERTDENNIAYQLISNLGQSFSSGVPSLKEAAVALGMSPWTLQRRLKAEGLVYKQLISDTRQQLAEEYLKNTDLPLKEVAFMLGYSELSAFSRAFTRCKGMSPQVYRKECIEGS